MSEDHVPAWKKINIIKQAQVAANGGVNVGDEDPLNVTTHLATGSLTKKQKKSIISKSAGDSNANKVAKPKKEKHRNKVKTDSKEKKSKILKDQLRYLIDFYLYKINDQLPAGLKELDYVVSNLPNMPADDCGVKEVWKFSKQKQNWLLKHFFSLDEIPAEFNQLLYDYFELMNGNSKTELTKQCQKRLTQWNDYVEEQESNMQQIIGMAPSKTQTQTQTQKEPAVPTDATNDNGTPESTAESATTTATTTPAKEETLPPSKEEVTRSKEMLETWLKIMQAKSNGQNESEIDSLAASLLLKNS